MLKKLHLKNLTVFPDAEFAFGKHLNVIIGENGSGKTHILKSCYVPIAVSARGAKATAQSTPTKTYLQTALATTLREVFKPDELGRLTRRQAGRNKCEVAVGFDATELDISFPFNTASKSEVGIDTVPVKWIEKLPVYLPTRKLLTVYPGFLSLYETTHLPFEETWRDTCLLLAAPLAKGPREKKIKELLVPLEEAMGGTIELDKSGRFYLNTSSGSMEMDLVAEGLRKLAMIARLIATGSLLDKGYLFWDEPEANLNPKIIKLIAKTILHLCSSGIQVFIATHSLFLLRELYILQKTEFKDLDANYFSLHFKDGAVSVQQGSSIDDVGDISALDEELLQSDRYMALEQGER